MKKSEFTQLKLDIEVLIDGIYDYKNNLERKTTIISYTNVLDFIEKINSIMMIDSNRGLLKPSVHLGRLNNIILSFVNGDKKLQIEFDNAGELVTYKGKPYISGAIQREGDYGYQSLIRCLVYNFSYNL